MPNISNTSETPLDDGLIIIDRDKSGDTQAPREHDFIDVLKAMLPRNSLLNVSQKVAFYRLLATMVNAGIPLMRSLSILEKQEKSKKAKMLIASVLGSIRQGLPFSAALELYPHTFGETELALIESGEKTGRLNSALLQLADQVEKVASITRKVKGALTYPMTIIAVMFLAVGVLMTVVIPKLMTLFEGQALPSSTQTLINISHFFQSYWIAMILSVIIGIAMLKIYHNTRNGAYILDSIMLEIPLGFGKIIRKVALSKFCRLFSNLLGSGVTVVESLKISAFAVGNERYKQRILLMAEDVKRGIKLADSVADDPMIPDMLASMIQVGEETAELEKVVVKIATFYDEEVDLQIAGISKIIEPIILVFMAVVVGGVALSVLQPIMNLSQNIGG
ncbi:MAG: type II secretion system F family protein [Candidatus Gracilibacteria bacterium]